MAGMTSSVTRTPTRVVLPVLVTSKVTTIVDPAVVDTAAARVFASAPSMRFTTVTPGAAAVALAESESVIGAVGRPLTTGVPVAVAVLVCWTPTAGAGQLAEQVAEAPGARVVRSQVIGEGIVSSVTVTSCNGVEPVFSTVKVTDIVDPGVTRTPGAVLASSPLIRLTTWMPGSTARANAGSVSRTTGTGAPVTRSTILVPSERTGVPAAVPVLVCWVRGAGATKVPTHVIDAPMARVVCGQLIAAAAMTESVTVTESSRVLPELVTRKDTETVSPVTISGPGAVLAS